MSFRAARFDALLYCCNYLVANFPSARLRHAFYRQVMQVEISAGAHILGGLWLDGRGKLSIGVNSVINQRCRLDNRGGITIGANVSVSPEVHIITADHDVHSPELIGRNAAVRIEDNVFIGSRATILPGVVVGACSAVAAGAVVTRNVADHDIVAGIPARKIGQRPEGSAYECNGRRHFF